MIKHFLPLQGEWIYCIVFELDDGSWDLHAVFVLKDCLFGAVKLTKISFLDKYSCSGYGIGLDSRSLFSIPNFGWDKNGY